MGKFLNFLTHNNAVPIAVSFLLLGAGSAFAANNPEVLLAKSERVLSIDNTYIVSKDLKKYTPSVEILAVEEDDDTYYITYTLKTIALSDSIWQDVTTESVLEVSKSRLDKYRDLGVFVTEQLNQIVGAESKRLRETQVYERKNLSQKRVATAYSGLVGGFLSEKVTTVKGYRPLVVPPKPKREPDTFAYPPALDEILKKEAEEKFGTTSEALSDLTEETIEDTAEATSTDDGGGEPIEPGNDQNASSSDDSATSTPDSGTYDGGGTEDETTENQPPVITVLGDNPVQIEIGQSYTDLGAVVSDDQDTGLNASLLLNDEVVENIAIDTSATGTHKITYYVTDSGGLTSFEERTVVVNDTTASDEDDSNDVPTDTGKPTTTPDNNGNGTKPDTGKPTTTPQDTGGTTDPDTGQDTEGAIDNSDTTNPDTETTDPDPSGGDQTETNPTDETTESGFAGESAAPTDVPAEESPASEPAPAAETTSDTTTEPVTQ